MKKHSNSIIVFLLISPFLNNTILAEQRGKSAVSDNHLGDISAIIEETVREVVDHTADKAKDVVRENTGIDLEQRGYSSRKAHEPLPECASDEARRELSQLQNEYNREVRQLEQELDKKLAMAENEFEREAAREDKPERVYEKRKRLEKKVDDAYAKFDEKISRQNSRFDQKRDRIINKQRGSQQCKEGDNGRGRDRDRQDHGKPDDRGPPSHAEERSDRSRASDPDSQGDATPRETEEKKWWRFWE